MTPLEALTAIWTPGKHSLCAETPGSSDFHTIGLFDSPEALLDRCALHSNKHLWWGVQPVKDGTVRRGTAADVAGVGVLACDFDWNDDIAHKRAAGLDRTEVIRRVRAMIPQPTVVIVSGNGLQPYWVLDEVLDPDSGKEALLGFGRYCESVYGLRNERKDISSVLRVPGTMNHKTSPPKPVEVLS